MIEIDDAPVPVIESVRKVGVELEIDIRGRGSDGCPPSGDGWEKKTDGSVQGWEYVFHGPVVLSTAKTRIDALCAKLVNINVHRQGGLHVHVQSNNYTIDDTYYLAMLYCKFQSVIDKLVAKSRRSDASPQNQYCKAHHPEIFRNSPTEFAHSSKVLPRVSGRGYAKNVGDRYKNVNLNMCACEVEDQRSVEFRQGSVSKRASVIYGWTCLMVALTEMAKDHAKVTSLQFNSTLDDMLNALRDYEQASGSENISAWVKWRYDYLNQEPTNADLERALTFISQEPVGLYGLSRALGINLQVTTRILEILKSKNLIFRTNGSAYKASYEFRSKSDLETMLTSWRNRPVVVETVPAATTTQLTPPPVAMAEAAQETVA